MPWLAAQPTKPATRLLAVLSTEVAAESRHVEIESIVPNTWPNKPRIACTCPSSVFRMLLTKLRTQSTSPPGLSSELKTQPRTSVNGWTRLTALDAEHLGQQVGSD